MFQIQELVSQGYIVAGVDNPGAVAAAVFPDGEIIKSIPKEELDALILKSISEVTEIPNVYGKEIKDGIIPYFSQDISSVINFIEKLNQEDSQRIFTNRIDTSKIGVLGVSLGGIIAAEAAVYDKRIKASLIMESRISKNALSKNISNPLMIITRDAESMRHERDKSGGWSEIDIQTHLLTMNTLYENSTSDSYFVQIPGMFHVDFTDAPLWFPFSRYLGLNGKLKPQEVHSILSTFTIHFFDKELAGKESSFLQNPTAKYKNILCKSK